MESTEDGKDEEKKQFKKLHPKWPNNHKFRQTRRELLRKYPELMSGIPMEMRYNPNKSVESKKPKSQIYKRNYLSKRGIILLFLILVSISLLWSYQNIPRVNDQLKELWLILQHLFLELTKNQR